MTYRLLWLAFGLGAISLASSAASNPAGGTGQGTVTASSLYLKIRVENPLKVSALKPGDQVAGKLLRNVYSGDHEVFPAGSRVQLTVDKLERLRRVPNDHWPWVIKFFTPRHQNSPTFQSGSVTLPSGTEIPLRVSLISIGREREIRAQAKSGKSAPDSGASSAEMSVAGPVPDEPAGKAGTIVTLEAAETSPEPQSAPALPSGPITLAAGTQARVILLGTVSASGSRPGDSFQARVLEPVHAGSQVVLPEGSLLEGKVVRRTPPRRLSRAGTLFVTFTSLSLPGGSSDQRIVASVASVEVDQRSHTKLDAEGELKGERPGKVWMLVNVGVTAGIAKEVDDGTQLLAEALISTATDASTAGTARIVSTCASGLFMLTRHGRDVVLPRFTEMDVVFDRPVSLVGAQAVPAEK